MSQASVPGAGGSETPPAEALEQAKEKIDLHALAEKLYRLLKEEARLERERLGRHQIR